MGKKKVLVLGIGQSNYILQLYGTIKPKLPEYSFNISGLHSLFKRDVNDKAKAIFDQILDLENTKWSFLQLFYSFFYVLTKKHIYKELVALLLDRTLSIRDIAHAFVRENMKPFLVGKKINKSDFKVLHFHFIAPHHIAVLKYLRKDFQVISTFWGSDLMRTTGHKALYYQKLALERSDIITSATYDMGNIILSKYGRHLQSKLRYAKFIHDPKVYDLIDAYRNTREWEDEFRDKYSIPKENKIVIIGHNATPANNHIKIIESFSVLSAPIQATFTCILPLTYAIANKGYLHELKSCTKAYKMQFLFLEEYLSWEELAQLKLIADVMIHMPTSDGLSAALTEYFYAGGLIVTASWLPYSTFCQAGLFYFQYDNFDTLKKVWTDDYKDKAAYKEKLDKNSEIIRKVFNAEEIANSWVAIFHELNN